MSSFHFNKYNLNQKVMTALKSRFSSFSLKQFFRLCLILVYLFIYLALKIASKARERCSYKHHMFKKKPKLKHNSIKNNYNFLIKNGFHNKNYKIDI